MTPEQQRIAIAEACGYKHCVNQDGIGYAAMVWVKPGLPTVPYPENLPDYLNDLNAMHEAEKVLTTHQYWDYVEWCQKLALAKRVPFVACGTSATATQRAEAFLRAIGKRTS